MKLYVCFIIICDFLLNCLATPVSVIQLEMLKYSKQVSLVHPPSFVVEQLFTMQIYANIYTPSRLRCSGTNSLINFVNHEIRYTGYYIKDVGDFLYALKYVIKATSAMNGIWNCTLFYYRVGEVDLTQIIFDLPVSVQNGTFRIAASLAATATDIIEINVYKDGENNKSVTVQRPLLTVHQKFKVKIQNLRDSKIYKKITCCYNNNTNIIFIESYLTRNKNSYTSEDVRVTSQMNAAWKCRIEGVNSKLINEFQFDVILRKTDDDIPTFLVNGATLNKTTKVLEKNISATAEYSYNEGELAIITCKKLKGNVMSMNYALSNGTQVFNTNASDNGKQTIYVKLTEKHQGSYLDCQVDYYSSLPSVIRLVLNMKQRTKSFDEPMLEVNGLMLAPNANKQYFYDYYNREPLSIMGRLDNPNSKWYCDPGKNSAPLEPVKSQKDRVNLTVTLDYDKSMSSSINCSAGKDIVHLTLEPFKPFDPMIHGLTLSQTLLAYQKNINEYVIKYKSMQSSLKLTCMSKMSKNSCKWDFNSAEVIADKYKFTKSANNAECVSSGTFKLMENIQKTIIRCKCNTSFISAEVINESGQQDPSKRTPSNEGPSTPAVSTVPLTPGTQKEIHEDKKNAGLPWKFILVAFIAGTLAIVILVVWIIVGVHKRKRKFEQAQSDINYENLPEHNEGPMPTPAQWNNYTATPVENNYYSVPNVENSIEEYSYAQPLQSQRHPVEMLYAEVGNYGEPTYAAVGQEGPNSQYNNFRKDQIQTYSQIQPKKLRDNAKFAPQVLPKPVNNDNYAQVLPKSVRKQSEAPKYVNVSPDPRYVNAPAGDYAEPAYCEITKKK